MSVRVIINKNNLKLVFSFCCFHPHDDNNSMTKRKTYPRKNSKRCMFCPLSVHPLSMRCFVSIVKFPH